MVYHLFWGILVACSAKQSTEHVVSDVATIQEADDSTFYKPTLDTLAQTITFDKEEPVRPSDKLALIVAIGTYKQSTAWTALGSHNDIPLIKAALSSQGFDTLRNLKVLRDAEATKENVFSAIRHYIIPKAKKGSKVVLHFSGHGQQLEDLNGDELDGLDEALVMYDAPKKAEGAYKTYKGEQHLTDDELGELIAEIKAKVGDTGQILVLLDACHSGTATRTLSRVRGTQHTLTFTSRTLTQNSTEGEQWIETDPSNHDATTILISASGAHELNYETRDKEGKWVGSLSYALHHVLGKATKGDTYQGLFDRLSAEMKSIAPHQTPQIEGAAMRQLWTAEVFKAFNYFTIKQIYNKTSLSLDAGDLSGLSVGTEILFFPIDVRDTTRQKALATGVVMRTSLTTSEVVLSEPFNTNLLKKSWAVPGTKNYGSAPVRLHIDIPESSSLHASLVNAVSSLSNILISSHEPELTLKLDAGQRLYLWSSDKKTLFRSTPKDDESTVRRAVLLAVEDYLRASFLRDLYHDVPELELEIAIVPIGIKHGEKYKPEKPAKSQGKAIIEDTLQLRKGDYIKLKITNKGSSQAYFSLLDIQPDNKINLIFPAYNRTAEEYHLFAGEEMLTQEVFQIGEPVGVEYFKLIASSKPFDVKPLLANSRGVLPARELLSTAEVKSLVFKITD
ncbi:caspase family protein [Porifericola rhodea]|uniref:caspase family protein n=1 Tax=Porifericola rhodea TaxID=930972 RepID=UPI002665AA7A|nr:caspase family protein [Porifericola rhodea]WKN32465.1 caspase family protein [Porifericola rhodea]